MAMIRIENLKLVRGTNQLFSDFSAEFVAGTITVITGPNGSGKSSLFAAISGDLPYEGGEIWIDGKALSAITDLDQSRLRSISLQERSFWLPVSVREILSLGQSQQDLSSLLEMAQSLNLDKLLNEPVTKLSVGQMQRVEIARTLLRDTPVYLLDEPFSAQDLASRERLIKVFIELRKAGKTLIFIAHSDAKSLSWCDQIIELGS